MKDKLHRICEILEISPQGYYKSRRQKQFNLIQEDMILKFVQDIRIKLPMLGGKKLFKMLNPEFKAMGIKLGRDKFFEILRQNGLLIHKKKRYMQTAYTTSNFLTYNF